MPLPVAMAQSPCHRAAHFPVMMLDETPEVRRLVASRVRGAGRRIITGSKDWRTKHAMNVAISLVGAMAEQLVERFGLEQQAGLLAASDRRLEGPDLDVQISLGRSGSLHTETSCGLAMAVALAGLVLGRAVHDDVIMTGEVDLRGNTRLIGGAERKIQAARRAGMRKLLMPRDNFLALDLQGLDQDLRAYVVSSVQPVSHIFDAIEHALAGE